MRANTIKTRRGIFNIILTALAAISLSAIATPVSAAIGWPGPEEGQCNYGKWAQGLIIMGGSIEGVVDSKEEERPSSCNVPLEVEYTK